MADQLFVFVAYYNQYLELIVQYYVLNAISYRCEKIVMLFVNMFVLHVDVMKIE